MVFPKRKKAMKRILVATILAILLSSCVRQVSTQKRLNETYDGELFDESWTKSYQSGDFYSDIYAYYVFEIQDASSPKEKMTSDVDEHFVERFTEYVSIIDEKNPIADEYSFAFDAPYSWAWYYRDSNIFSYNEKREYGHLLLHDNGELLLLLPDKSSLLYVIEKDFH